MTESEMTPADARMLRFLGRFERAIILVLLALMMLAILLATADLVKIVAVEIWKAPRFLLGLEQIMSVFGLFFMILIGLELLETIKTYLSREEMHVEIVFLVAMIAVARKVIILKLKEIKAPILFGIAALILGLSAGYFLVKLAHRRRRPS